ncbi:unnamed protein product, partial [Amoebophrya sp. A25]|eukprot:GSA25T00017944001.1
MICSKVAWFADDVFGLHIRDPLLPPPALQNLNFPYQEPLSPANLVTHAEAALYSHPGA